MKLNYRGVQYDYNPESVDLLNSNPTSTDLKYRWNIYPTNLPVDSTTVEAANVPVAIAPQAPEFSSTEQRARLLMMNHHRAVKRRQQAMLTRLAVAIGEDVETASHYWNHVQGKVHPSFWATYDRSHAACS